MRCDNLDDGGAFMTLKEKIEQILSEILSDKYDCKITLHFEKQGEYEDDQSTEDCA